MDIFNAIKLGDMARVIYLVEEQQIELQQHDEWDGTPLYYASFTGNKEVVKYLLARGATCERRTFDGERCLYAALNDDTRDLLLCQGFQRAGAGRHDLYLDFMGKLVQDPDCFPDIEFHMPWGRSLRAHRFLLASRCPGLGRMIDTVWSRERAVKVGSSSIIEPHSLEAIIRWCYTARLTVSTIHKASCLVLLALFEQHDLGARLSEARPTGEMLLVDCKVPEARIELQSAMSRTAEACFSGRNTDASLHHDVVITAGTRRLLAHKAVLYLRSKYFKVLLSSTGFKEGRLNHEIMNGNHRSRRQIQHLEVGFAEPETVDIALRWMYTDQLPQDLAAERLLKVLRASEAFISEGLKQKCSLRLQPFVSHDTVIPYLAEALDLEAERLFDACLWYIAKDLRDFIDQPDFAELVRKSASSVKDRQDVDSVPIVDEIRFYITQLHGEDFASENEAFWDEDCNIVCPDHAADFKSLSARNQKYYLLQNLLDTLGLEA